MNHREEMSGPTCEAARRVGPVEIELRPNVNGKPQRYRKVYMCGKPAKVYLRKGDPDGVALCDEHKDLI